MFLHKLEIAVGWQRRSTCSCIKGANPTSLQRLLKKLSALLSAGKGDKLPVFWFVMQVPSRLDVIGWLKEVGLLVLWCSRRVQVFPLSHWSPEKTAFLHIQKLLPVSDLLFPHSLARDWKVKFDLIYNVTLEKYTVIIVVWDDVDNPVCLTNLFVFSMNDHIQQTNKDRQVFFRASAGYCHFLANLLFCVSSNQHSSTKSGHRLLD